MKLQANPRHWAARWLPVAAWMGFIQYASVRTVVEIGPETLPQADKLLHALAYALLALLIVRALRAAAALALGDVALAAFAWATAFGALQEMLQHFIPKRSCDLLDLLSNGLGAGLAVLAWYLPRHGIVRIPPP